MQYSKLFRVFRSWSQQAKLQKRQKSLKKLLLNGLVKAIGKHEELLAAKTFRALKMQKRLNYKHGKRADYITNLVARNIKAFYFRLMMKKYREVSLARNLTGLALSHFKGCLRQRILLAWRQTAKERKDRMLKVLSLIKRKPQSILVLVNFLGFSVMPR